MKLRYIGAHGSMGLLRNQVYEVSLVSEQDAIVVRVYYGSKCIATIPYSSPQTLADNWARD